MKFLAEHLLWLSAYVDLREIAEGSEVIYFEGSLLNIGIEAAGTSHTDFIAVHDVGHQDLVINRLTLIDVVKHRMGVIAGLAQGCIKDFLG